MCQFFTVEREAHGTGDLIEKAFPRMHADHVLLDHDLFLVFWQLVRPITALRFQMMGIIGQNRMIDQFLGLVVGYLVPFQFEEDQVLTDLGVELLYLLDEGTASRVGSID